MAVGFDRALPSRSRSPLSAPSQGMQQGAAPSFGARPPAVSDYAVQNMTNSQRAAPMSAYRQSLTEGDRAGMSRGRGQQLNAQMAQAGQDAQGRAAAAQTEMEAGKANATANLAYDSAMRGEALGNSGLLEGLRNTNAMANWQRRGFGQDMREAVARGQFGLNGIQLDYNPLLESLLQ